MPKSIILTGHHGTDKLFKEVWKEARMGQSKFNIFNFTTEAEREKLCRECRACCQLSAIPTPFEPGYMQFSSVVDFYQKKGFRTTLMNGHLYVVVDVPCKNISDTGCMIYSHRPAICKNYDGRKDGLVKEQCAWHLAEVEAYNKSKEVREDAKR